MRIVGVVMLVGLALGAVAFSPLRSYAYEEINVVDGGAISGRVRFVGTVPKLESIQVTKEKDKAYCGSAVPSEALVVSSTTRGVKDVVVSLENITRGKRLTQVDESILDNKQCLFAPHVQVVVRGTNLLIKNSDPILHNTRADLGSRTVFNLSLPIRGMAIKKPMIREGVLEIRCDVHTHMQGFVVVKGHPYVTLTDDQGFFRLTDVPAGTYRLQAWHRGWKVTGKDEAGYPRYEGPHTLEKRVIVVAKREVKVDFDLASRP